MAVMAFTMGHGSGVVIYGTNGPFKTIQAGINHRYQRTLPIHLTDAKLRLVAREALFTASHAGTTLEEGEFRYVSRDGYLRITNIETVSGVAVDESEGFAIPILYRERERDILTNIHAVPVPTELVPPPEIPFLRLSELTLDQLHNLTLDQLYFLPL